VYNLWAELNSKSYAVLKTSSVCATTACKLQIANLSTFFTCWRQVRWWLTLHVSLHSFPGAWLCSRGNSRLPLHNLRAFTTYILATPQRRRHSSSSRYSECDWEGLVREQLTSPPLNRYCSSLILIDAQELSIIALRYDRRAEREKGVVRTDTRADT
jgi:hypothetical protein